MTPKVPDLKGFPFDKAEVILKEKGLQISIADSVLSEDVSEGFVATQSPIPGSRLRRGKKVRVNISRGIKMPSFCGKTLDYTLRRLRECGATPRIESLQTDEVSKGEVVSTDPSTGEKLPVGEYVTVTVSTGRKTCPNPECRKEMEPNWHFCPYCKKRLD